MISIFFKFNLKVRSAFISHWYCQHTGYKVAKCTFSMGGKLLIFEKKSPQICIPPDKEKRQSDNKFLKINIEYY